MVGLLGGEVHPVHPPAAHSGGHEEEILLRVQGVPETVIGLPGQIAVAEPGVIQAPQLVQLHVEAPQVLQLIHHAAGLVQLVLQLLLLLVEGGGLVGQAVKVAGHLLQRGRGIKGGVVQGNPRLVGHLYGAAEQGGVGVLQLQRAQAAHPAHKLERILRMELLVDDAGAHHIVKPIQGPGDGEQLHRDNGHRGISFLSDYMEYRR